MHFPTIKQLRYFLALSEHMHFRRAAQACAVSQSAFSVAIRELETVLGVQLVDRTNKQVTMTKLGQDVVVQARLVLRDLADLVEVAEGQQKKPLSGELRFGIIPTIAPFVLPRILEQLHKDYPDLILYLKEDITDNLYTELMNGSLDVILMAFPYELRSVESLPLFDDEFLLAFRKDTAMFNAENYVSSRLQKGSVLLLEDGHCMRDHAMESCKLKKTDKISRYSASSLLTLIQMVNADIGLTFLPKMLVESDMLQKTQIKTMSVKGSGARQIGLSWRRGTARASEFQLLGSCINKYMGKRDNA